MDTRTKSCLWVVVPLLSGVILITGCETTKSLGSGIASTAASTAKAAKKDITTFWGKVKKADGWMRENLW